MAKSTFNVEDEPLPQNVPQSTAERVAQWDNSLANPGNDAANRPNSKLVPPRK